MRRPRPHYLCERCGERTLPVRRLVDGYPTPVSRCCGAYLVRLSGPTPGEYLREKSRAG